ncbi:MAG: DUF2851 family protein, partial [Flavisolibacter sp.]
KPYLMTEKLFQFIWQFQYFNKTHLKTVTGEKVEILSAGLLNTNQGPDFINARIKIDDTILAGYVELHIKTSQWYEHGHHNDINYKNVVLHVVFEHNAISPGSIPVLELKSRISMILLDRYSNLMNGSSFIPCINSISKVNDIVWMSWKDRLIAERLTRKSEPVFQFLEQNKYHWEETFWWVLARNFGIKVNSEAFESIARSIPLNILAKHKSQIHQLEALLLGQANFLHDDLKDEYGKLLFREYIFLKKKYDLKPVTIPVLFLRMRPGNFPTIRLAQLAALLLNSTHLFSKILEFDTVEEIKTLFDITANDYWHYHYKLDEPSDFKKKIIGKEMINNIIINTIVPVLFAYGIHHKEEKYKEKAIEWLQYMEKEINIISKGFQAAAIPIGSAFDSQSLIELKTQYCDKKNCLKCAVGNNILKLAE